MEIVAHNFALSGAPSWSQPANGRVLVFAAGDGRWITIDGVHVHLKNGRIDKGPAALVGKSAKVHPKGTGGHLFAEGSGVGGQGHLFGGKKETPAEKPPEKPARFDAGPTSAVTPGLYGQPIVPAATGSKQGAMFDTAAAKPASEPIKGSANALDPKHTGEMFPKAATGAPAWAEPAAAKGQLNSVRAPVGGAVSDVDGKHYKGGQAMPIHGQYSGQEKPPAKPADATGGMQSEHKNEPKNVTPRAPMTAEERAAKLAEVEDQRKWNEMRAGPLGQVAWMGDMPGKHASPELEKWKAFAESIGPAKVARLRDALAKAHAERIDKATADWDDAYTRESPENKPKAIQWEKDEPKRQAEQTVSSQPRKAGSHEKKLPGSMHARQLLTSLMDPKDSGKGVIDNLHDVHNLMQSSLVAPPSAGALDSDWQHVDPAKFNAQKRQRAAEDRAARAMGEQPQPPVVSSTHKPGAKVRWETGNQGKTKRGTVLAGPNAAGQYTVREAGMKPGDSYYDGDLVHGARIMAMSLADPDAADATADTTLTFDRAPAGTHWAPGPDAHWRLIDDPIGKGKGFSRAELHRKLLKHHEEVEGKGSYTAADEKALNEAAGSGDPFVFHRKLPPEIKEFMQGRPELRKLFRVSHESRDAGGADAFGELGDRYLEIAEAKAGSPLKAALNTARNSPDPEMRFAAAIHDNMPAAKDRAPQTRFQPGDFHAGQKFTIDGEPFRVVEDADGHKVIHGHGEDFPLDALHSVPVDRGSLKSARRAKPKADDVAPFSSPAGVLEFSAADLGAFSAADDVPGQPADLLGEPCHYFWKDVYRTGTFRNPVKGHSITASDATLRQWARTGKAMLAKGIRVPVVCDHKEHARECVGYAVDFKVEGDRIQALCQLIGDDATKLAACNDVSVGVNPDYEDADGTRYGSVIQHVALTPNPVLYGLGPFTKVMPRGAAAAAVA